MSLSAAIAWLLALIIVVILWLLMIRTEEIIQYMTIGAFGFVTAAAIVRIIDRLICGD